MNAYLNGSLALIVIASAITALIGAFTSVGLLNISALTAIAAVTWLAMRWLDENVEGIRS